MSGPISDRFGRRGAMFTGCLLLIVGSILLASSHVKEQFIVGRFVRARAVYPPQMHYSPRPCAGPWMGHFDRSYGASDNPTTVLRLIVLVERLRPPTVWRSRLRNGEAA